MSNTLDCYHQLNDEVEIKLGCLPLLNKGYITMIILEGSSTISTNNLRGTQPFCVIDLPSDHRKMHSCSHVLVGALCNSKVLFIATGTRPALDPFGPYNVEYQACHPNSASASYLLAFSVLAAGGSRLCGFVYMFLSLPAHWKSHWDQLAASSLAVTAAWSVAAGPACV